MFRITSSDRFVMAQPNTAWSLEPGANHFEGLMPDPVAVTLRQLVRKGLVKVETLDLNAHATPWEPEADKKTDSVMPPSEPVAAVTEVAGKPSGFFGKK